MPPPRHILIVAMGSLGDTHPFLAIARGLVARGHRVKFLAPAVYEELVKTLELDFVPIGTAEDFNRMIENPDLWHARRGFNVIAEGLAKLAQPTYDAVVKNHEPGKSILVISVPALVARVAQEKLGLPGVTIHLSPAVLRSNIAPPYFPGAPLAAWQPNWFKNLVWNLIDWAAIDRLMGGPINQLRASVGLAPVRHVMDQWVNSPDLAIGMFPDWFAPPPGDWPRQLVLAGFPLYDEADIKPMDERLCQFLESGSAPIAFTAGSVMNHGREFFADAVEICRRLNRRGLLLTRHDEHVPRSLPRDILHVSYAPFSLLLPKCLALVHHGGIGTSAQTLAAGIPHLVRPMSHDQPDNARRLMRLGVARSIPAKKFTAARAARALDELLDDPTVAVACAKAKLRLSANDSVNKTIQLIENVARK